MRSKFWRRLTLGLLHSYCSFLAFFISQCWRLSVGSGVSSFDSNCCSSALAPLCYVRIFQPQGKARAEMGTRAGDWSLLNCTCCSSCPWEEKEVNGSQLLPCRLCFALAAAATKAASLGFATAKGVTTASLLVWLPLVIAYFAYVQTFPRPHRGGSCTQIPGLNIVAWPQDCAPCLLSQAHIASESMPNTA